MDKLGRAEAIALLEEVRAQEGERLFALGRKIVPYLTREDLLQPNDYPELEMDGEFRYQEGVVAGLATAVHALKA